MACPPLKIPWPRPASVAQEEENYKALERWADAFRRCVGGVSRGHLTAAWPGAWSEAIDGGYKQTPPWYGGSEGVTFYEFCVSWTNCPAGDVEVTVLSTGGTVASVTFDALTPVPVFLTLADGPVVVGTNDAIIYAVQLESDDVIENLDIQGFFTFGGETATEASANTCST